jgi:hypothetical protein
MTQSKKLGWLNSTTGWIEGTNNLLTNEAAIKICAMKNRKTANVHLKFLHHKTLAFNQDSSQILSSSKKHRAS